MIFLMNLIIFDYIIIMQDVKDVEEIIKEWSIINDPNKVLNLSHLNLKTLPPIPGNCRTLGVLIIS